MKELHSLVAEIQKEQKIPTAELVMILTTAICEEEPCCDTYKHIYEKAYGYHLNKETAERWVKSLPVTDGSDREHGEKWTIDKTSEIGQRLGVDWGKMNKYEWYAGMNAWYSDFYRTAQKYELEKEAEFYADLLMDYFCYDSDAKRKTMFNYYFEHVV